MTSTSSFSLKRHQPFYREVAGARTLVVFIHGITEGPAYFRPFIEMTTACGCSCASLLLPGHGGSQDDFARTNRKEWTDYVAFQLQRYKRHYPRLLLAGHSMGALLSVIAYADDPSQIGGLICLHAPLYVQVSSKAVRNNLRLIFDKEVPADDPAYPMSQCQSIERGPIVQYITWLPRLIDLFNLIERTRNLLPQIRVPLLAVHADQDELVGEQSVDYYQRLAPHRLLRLVRLPHSTHFSFSPDDWALLSQVYREMLSDCG